MTNIPRSQRCVGQISPVVSVVLTVYNRARFVAEAIDSILAQTLADFELIIVDDGSTDNSPRVIADYAERDSRVSVISQKNAGLVAARNVGAKKARADLLAFMDDDDHSLPTRLQKQADFLHFHPDADYCLVQANHMDESGKPIQDDAEPRPLPSFFAESDSPVYLIGQFMMIRRRAFWEVGGFRKYFRMMEEIDFTLRFFESHRPAGILAEYLYCQRIYPATRNKTNITGGFPLLQFKYTAAAIASSHCRRERREDPIIKNPPLDAVMKELSKLPEESRIYLMRQARNCTRRILRDLGERVSFAEFWEMVGYISDMSSGLESRANAVFRWLLWQSLRYGRFAVAARLIKNFAAGIIRF